MFGSQKIIPIQSGQHTKSLLLRWVEIALAVDTTKSCCFQNPNDFFYSLRRSDWKSVG